MANQAQDSSMKTKVLLAWGFVGIPLLWGVYKTIDAATALFK